MAIRRVIVMTLKASSHRLYLVRNQRDGPSAHRRTTAVFKVAAHCAPMTAGKKTRPVAMTKNFPESNMEQYEEELM